MEEIKIYVSHRIDIESVRPANLLYVPVRCGAVLDHSEKKSKLPGDDTRENISAKRLSYGEFTVQYWAWKNTHSDYVGLCHYRRYLAFDGFNTRRNDYNMLLASAINKRSIRKFGLVDEKRMRQMISNSDALVPEPACVSDIIFPPNYPKKHVDNVRDLWDNQCGVIIEEDTIPYMLQLIDDLAPEYSRSAREYLNGKEHRGFNCYVMRWELFDRMCRLQFPIMAQMEKHYAGRAYKDNRTRIPGYVGELLFGIFFYHLSVYEHYTIKSAPIVLFQFTERGRGKNMINQAKLRIKRGYDLLGLFLFPLNTRRRRVVKKLIYTLLGKSSMIERERKL